MSSDQLTPADVRDVWDDIKPGLEYTKEKANAPWRVEDVYAACLVGTAFLYVGEPGFVVLQPHKDLLTGEPELLVWVAYSRAPDSIKRFQPAIDAVAKEHGFKKLVMQSARTGWSRVPGWSAISVNYERILE